jgi:hypothetical protein
VHHHRLYSTEDVRLLSRQRLIFPGDPEPEWLRRNAAFARRLAELRQEAAHKAPPSRLMQRLALVFGR